jgi:general secretion pathway protein L
MATTFDAEAKSRTPYWRQRLNAFWRWWSGELAHLVPERFVAMTGTKRVPVIALEGEQLVQVDPRGPAGSEVARMPLSSLEPDEGRAALRGLLERAGETRARVRICLGRDESLLRRVAMPAATEENLRQVLAFEMDRLTPFRADEVYYDYRVVSRDTADARVNIDLGVARRDVVEGRLELFRKWGANVQGVALRDDAGHGDDMLDLLPLESRGERETGNERIARLALLGLVALLFIAALFVPALLKRETIKAMHPVLAKAETDARATDALARDLEKQVADYNFLLTKKYSTYPALAYVEEISRLLPDQTWVQQMDLKAVGKNRELQISGETNSSSKLIELLEQSSLLQNATQRGTLTRGSQPGLERYMIAAEARPRPLPETQPVVASAEPAPPPPSGAPAKPAAPPAASTPPTNPPPVPAKVEVVKPPPK